MAGRCRRDAAQSASYRAASSELSSSTTAGSTVGSGGARPWPSRPGSMLLGSSGTCGRHPSRTAMASGATGRSRRAHRVCGQTCTRSWSRSGPRAFHRLAESDSLQARPALSLQAAFAVAIQMVRRTRRPRASHRRTPRRSARPSFRSPPPRLPRSSIATDHRG